MGRTTIRTFFALPLSINCQKEIELFTSDLKKEFPMCLRWVKVSQLHITMKFLGHFREEHLALLYSDLKAALKSTNVFTLYFQNIGIFPTINKPNVLWLGIRKSFQLSDLFSQLENSSKRLGYVNESRDFSPHLTIGRFNSIYHQQNKKLIERIGSVKKLTICDMKADRINFIQSKLTTGGPIYSNLFSITFNSKKSLC